MEAQFACADLSAITDEDLLRKMWQQAEDFSRKKEIRAYMYKLREQRLKDFYASNDSSPPYFLMDNASATFGLKKSTVTGSHGDSLVDQSFESFKTKEIRDSESPTRFGNMAIPSDNSGWQIRTSEEVSEDGKTHTVRTSATTQGIKEIDGGRTAFAGKNLESHSEHYDGDESNFVHSKGDQSTTVLVEDSITEDANGRSVSGSTHSTTTSVSSTRVVYQHQNGDSERPKKQSIDATDQGTGSMLEFGDDHFSSSQKRTVTSSSSSSVLRNSATTKNVDTSTTNTTDVQSISGEREEQTIPKELSKDPERVREAFRLAQGAGKIIERDETMVNASTKMITETKRLDDGTTVTTRTYEKITHEPTSTGEKVEEGNRPSAKMQPDSVGRSGRPYDGNATNEFIRQEKANQSSTSMTKTSSQRIMVEVDAAHDSFARSLRSVSPTGSVRSVRSNVTLAGRTSASPEKAQPTRTESDTKPDYMRSTFTSERKMSGFQEHQSGTPTQRSPSPRKVSETSLHAAGSRSTSPTKQSSTTGTAREYEKTTESQTRVTESERQNYPEVDGIKARGSTKPPLVRSETYEERCRKILGMPNRPVDDDVKGESKSIFSTYDNTVTVQQSRSEMREQRKKIEQEIKSIESQTTNSRQTMDEQDSVVEKERSSSRKSSVVTKDTSPSRKLSSQQTSPTRTVSSTPKESSPTRKGLVEDKVTRKSSPVKDSSPSRKTVAREISPMTKEVSPTRKQSKQEDDSHVRKSPVKDVSPTRKSPAKDVSPIRAPSLAKDVSPTRKPSQPEPVTARTSPAKETSPSRKPTRDDLPLKSERVESPVKLTSETTTKTKATILVEQKKEGRNISVAEITILPVMEVSESVRTKTTTARTHEKILTKQSSDSKFDRRPTATANSRIITNKSSSDFDVKRRAAEMATQSKTRSSATSPDKRRPAAGTEKSVPVKQNHITVAKIKIESMRKPSTQTKTLHGTTEEISSVRSGIKREQVSVPKRPVEPETDPESSKDTGISDNSEVEETVESVIEMNVTGTSCCRHTDRKDSAPVYRTTGVAKTGKNYTRSSSDNHLRATNASTNRQTSSNLNTISSKSTTTGGRKVERPVKHVATKTINLSTKAVTGVSALSTNSTNTLGSDHLDNVVIDIQLAKSSREPTPNKLIPIPVSPDTEDTGKPRYPDAVQEPDDDTSGGRQNRTQRVNNIPIFEEATNEYVGCEITEVDETTTQHATRITNLDRVTEDDESLLSVTEKVNKFAQEARRLQEPSNSGITDNRPQTARFSARPEYDDIDEHLKSDECLLSVSDKVTKFISTAEEVKKIRTSGPFVPENEDVPVKVTEGDECLLSVNEKVNRFANRIQRTSETREHDTTSSTVGRTGGRLPTFTEKDQFDQQESEEEEEMEENEETKQQRVGVSESVSGRFVPQKSPELVKNAMRSTARHIVEDTAAEDLTQTSGSSIANRYRTTTMSKQYEKQTPSALAPCTSPITLRSTEAVKKAKQIFEKGQAVQDVRQRDILNRPSIWEDRRNKQQQSQHESKSTDLKLADIGVTERKTTQSMREEGKVVEGQRKESVTKVESVVEPEPTKPVPTHGRRDSGSGVRPPTYIRDTVSAKKDMFEKRISSSKIQVEYTTQTSQEGTETSTLPRRQSLKQQGDTSATSRPAHTVMDHSKPSYMNHTVASLEHINANQRRDSLDHGVAIAHNEATTVRTTTSSAKFGVELKRLDTGNRTATTQSTAASSKRKTSSSDAQPGVTGASTPVIEEIFDLEMLERMLESVTGYEQRRRIRAQIRVVKKQKEQQQTSAVGQTGKQTNVTSVKTVTSTHSSTVTNTRDSNTSKRKDSSPTRSSALPGRKQSTTATADAIDAVTKVQESFETDKMAERNSKQRQQQEQESVRNAATNVSTTTKTTTVVTDRFAAKPGAQDRHPTTKDDRPIWATSNILKKASENTRTFKSSSVTSSSSTAGVGSAGGRKVVSTTSSYQQVKSSTDPKTTTDCITSSYGVGPTDENGLPLFGIRALKKKAAPAPATTEDTKISGTIVTETLYAENGGPAVGKRSTTHYTNEPGTFSEIVRNSDRSDTGHETHGDDGLGSNQKTTGKMMAIRKTETIDAGGMHTEEFEVMDGLEMAARRDAKVVRKGSVKELTERFIHRESSGSLTQESTRTYPKAGLILRSSAQSQSSRASTPATDGCSMQSGSVDEFEQEQMETGVTTRQVRSFLNDTSKVVDVRDVLQRMSNADNVTEQGDSVEDQEARALLNKFLGASVLMSGVESMVSSTGSMLSETASLPSANTVSTKKVSKVSSTTSATKTVKSSGTTPSTSSSKQATLDNLDDNWDEAVLKQLLESTTNYDDRRKIRARIRQVMAEKEACADIVAIVTADLQRERHLQQQSTAPTAGTGGSSDRQSATTAVAANGLSQGESLLLPLLQGLLLSNAAAFGYKGNTFAGNAVEVADVGGTSSSSSSSGSGNGGSDSCGGSHINSSTNGKTGTASMAVSKIPPVEDSGTESGEDLRLLAAAGLHDIGNAHASVAASAGANSSASVNGNGGAFSAANGLPSILSEVATALERLQSSLQGDPNGQPKVMQIDAEQRRALLALIARLQQGLQQPDKLAGLGIGDAYDNKRPSQGTVATGGNGLNDAPDGSGCGLDASQNRTRAGSSRFGSKRRTTRNNRHTVGVSREELADARRFIEEMVRMDNRHQPDQSVTSPEKAYILQKQQSLGTVLGTEPDTLTTVGAVQSQPMQNGGSTAPATAFAMKRPSQFVPKEMQNVQTSLDKLVLPGTGGKSASSSLHSTPAASQVRTKPSKEKLLIRQSMSVDQDLLPTAAHGALNDKPESVGAKPIDLHKHKQVDRISKHHHQQQPQQPQPQPQQQPQQPELPFKKPTQTVAQRALVKKYSFNDGSSSDEDVARRAQRKTDETTKTAEQMVLRNKLTPAEQLGPAGSSIVINTVQKIVSRETKPSNNGELSTKSQSVTRRAQHLHGSRTPESHKDDASARPLNKYASKKLRMKRANTIDLPKSLPQHLANDDGVCDEDDSRQEQMDRSQNQTNRTQAATKHTTPASKYLPAAGPAVPPVDVPDFKPRTENDLKFMAFLQRQNQQSRQVWTKPVREHVGSNNWTNKFDHLKSNFEQAERRDRSELPPKYGAAPKTSAMNFWKQAESGSFDETTKPGPVKQHAKSVTPNHTAGFKSGASSVGRVASAASTTSGSPRTTQTGSKYGPTTSHTFNHNTPSGSPIVEGKLVLPKAAPGSSLVNQFSHAPASAFKPIPKKIPPANLEFKPIQQELDIVKPIPARISNATGLVKQIVATGFKETPEVKPEPMHVQLGLVRSLAAQGYQETPYVPLPKLERTPTHNVLNYKPRTGGTSLAEPAPPAPWVGKRSSEVTGPAGSRVASIAATKFTANSFGHNKPSLPMQQPLTYQGSLKYAEKPLTYQQMSGGSLPYEKRASLPDVSAAHLVQQTTTRTIANTKMESQDGSAVTTRTTVTTKTVASSAPKPMSPFAKFRQLDKQNSLSSQSPPNSPKTPTPTTPSAAMGPMFKFTDPALNRRAATVKDQLLQWCQMKTKEYENVKIENFSTSWSDGMAFCALIHHFLPDAFDFSKLTPQQRRHNFTLAFRVADEKAGIAPLLDVDDMVAMRKPDWKCVFTYVQSIYRRFKNEI